MGKLGFFLSVILISAVVISLIVNCDLYVASKQLEGELARARAELPILGICMQSPVVREYLNQSSNVQHSIMKLYVKSDGSVYTVGDNWELKDYVGGTDAPVDGKSHYCWRVHWYQIGWSFGHIVNVFIDKDSWEIVSVEEAW